MEGFQEICRQAFNISPVEMQQANANLRAYYGDRFMSASRIFASNGEVDPWYNYEIVHANPDREIYAYTIGEMGHAADTFPRAANESKLLTAAREFQLGIIKKWIDDLKLLDLDFYNWWFGG